jgi:hypothetical protein
MSCVKKQTDRRAKLRNPYTTIDEMHVVLIKTNQNSSQEEERYPSVIMEKASE